MVDGLKDEIFSTIENLKKAKENLHRIETEYASEQELLEFYSLSAKQLVKNLETHLEYLLKEETGSQYSIESVNENLDIWIRIEGENFKNGKGPINIVGSYLQKLNKAIRHSTNLVKSKYEDLEEVLISPSFELVATAKGSLKLGLQSNMVDFISTKEFNQIDLFEDNKLDHDLERLDKFNKINNLTKQSVEMLFKALASAEDENKLNELRTEFEDEDIIKLIHYAQELAPSSRSSIEFISFEGDRAKQFKNLKTDKHTRVLLKDRIKRLRINKEFVEGSAFIRKYSIDADEDHYVLTARPFRYENKQINDIELFLDRKTNSITEEDILNNLVYITGFLYYTASNQPSYIKVDTIENEKLDNPYDE
ncbi:MULTISPECIES: hypothetical protein [Bacillus]|uniref:hypothetical protein n=1 Tax=Bacillus TaxID=1386 RepID=UPI0018E9D64F|nr:MULTISPECIES: hypothetical protein [Bacillus subtilis group]MBJ3804350.1 hypothetical protein [Bacillus subtilis]MBR0019672.1 hypothetical protein [Bacillus subtilis]MEC1621071.1 hypothetical protein [Bacillus mojavensis]MEC2386125.1 hypothetical protein [Bacillus subtilis]MED4522354.1 hypothetical protein [Bacillus subtilis]